MNNEDKLMEAIANVPFWALERAVQEERENLKEKCEKAISLKQALDTGVNAVYLRHGGTGEFDDNWDEYIGYKALDGDYHLVLEYEKVAISGFAVEFECLDVDEDGYTVAIYREDN